MDVQSELDTRQAGVHWAELKSSSRPETGGTDNNNRTLAVRESKYALFHRHLDSTTLGMHNALVLNYLQNAAVFVRSRGEEFRCRTWTFAKNMMISGRR